MVLLDSTHSYLLPTPPPKSKQIRKKKNLITSIYTK